MEPSPIKVVVADDHPLFRSAIVRTLGDHPALVVAGEASDGDQAVAAVRELDPDVALVDLRMPSRDGFAVLRAVQEIGLATPVVFLSASSDSATVHEALAAGAAGFISKDTEAGPLCDAVLAATRGEVTVSPSLQAGVFAEIASRHDPAPPLLSSRELEVLQLAARGASGTGIGQRLYISPATVKTHMQRIFEKLAVSDRTAAVAEALRRGLIQ